MSNSRTPTQQARSWIPLNKASSRHLACEKIDSSQNGQHHPWISSSFWHQIYMPSPSAKNLRENKFKFYCPTYKAISKIAQSQVCAHVLSLLSNCACVEFSLLTMESSIGGTHTRCTVKVLNKNENVLEQRWDVLVYFSANM